MSELNFLIKPCSYLCNLQCGYCFYLETRDVYPQPRPIMSQEIAQVFVEKTLGFGADRVSFCWQGGEPTLAGLEFYRAVMAMQQKYRHPGQVIMNSLQTNGIRLDRDWANFLRRHNILVGISLDGPREIHDRWRVTSTGRGTFDQVMSKIRLLQTSSVQFNILTLLTKANIDQPDQLFAFFRQHQLNYLQFIPYWEWDARTGTPTPYSINGPELGRFYVRLFELWLDNGFPHVSIRLFEDLLSFLLDGTLLSCTSQPACSSYLVVEHNGDCYPCDFFVRPEWKLGNVVTDSIADVLSHSRRSIFAVRKADVAADCDSCSCWNFCHGDCLKFRHGQTPSHQSISHLCQGWRMIVEHVRNHPRDIVEMARQARIEHASRFTSNPARNDPCPCGSGRKYKRCCAGRSQGA